MTPTRINRDIQRLEYDGGLYLRLSKEEAAELRKKGQSVSSSIKTQELLLRECFKEKGINVKKVYIDDGLTGQRYDDRTDFQRMKKDWENGVINAIGTKDMSRLGRDLIDTCTYVQRVFPKKKIRYIAVLDDFDSLYDDATDERVVTKIAKNDTFSKTISINVSNGKKANMSVGLYMSTYPKYRLLKRPSKQT